MNKKLKIKIIVGIGFICFFALLMVFLFYGKNFAVLKSFFEEKPTQAGIKEKMGQFGWRGQVTVAILAMLQVVLTFLPAEPAQVLSGVAYGFWGGFALCTLGVIVGNTAIYLMYQLLGDRLSAYFDKNLNINFKKVSRSGKVTLLVFLLYFLPAIPYGMICFLAATVRMKYPRYILVTVLGSIPSICIGVGLGHMAINSSWKISVAVFLVVVILLIVMFIKKEALFKKVNELVEKKAQVKKYSRIKLDIAFFISKIVLFLKGIKVKYYKNATIEDGAGIVLCSHGSFVDFAYAGTLLKKRTPNFIVARLYFYRSLVGNFIRGFGCFPKSMFTTDLDSAKNCLRVLRFGGILAMMPEARLSTVGKFEDIQDGTFDFLKTAGVPVYTVKIDGSYFAKPKWGGKMRRGALVEATLDKLFDPSELKEMGHDEIKERVEKALYFNDFEWLKNHPEVEYESKKIAEGLENILTLCPSCHSKYSMKTKGNTIECECCGYKNKINSRYEFTHKNPFENFAEWYAWQELEMRRAIDSDPNFKLSSRVTLKHSSQDGKTMLRLAGYGVCTFDKNGLTYRGTDDGVEVEKNFPMSEIYRILFGAGEDFEIYDGREIYYFVPEEKRSCVDWYTASKLYKESSINAIVE